jgi:glucose-1-phosphate cytidylyltransferase
MTGARIKRIQKYVGDEDFMLTYGDGVGNIDLNGLASFHKEHGRVLTVTGVRPPGRFGELVHSNGEITEFNEKPQATGGRISGGFFAATPKIFDYLGADEDLVFEQDPMRSLVDHKQLMVFEHNGFWQPMDTSREFQLLNSLYETGEAPWVNW